MENTDGTFVDIYIPRKCSASHQLIGASDNGSIQIRFVELDPQTGRFNGKYRTLDIAGSVRAMGESDDSIGRLCSESGILPKNWREMGRH